MKLRIQLAKDVSGKVASIFIASSVAIIMIGIFTYTRNQFTWLQIYPPAGTFSGIWFFSYIIWACLWITSFFLLRKRENAGNIKFWLILFLVSVAISTVFVEASLNWSLLFK